MNRKLSFIAITLSATLLAACGTSGTHHPQAAAKPSTPTQAADGTLIGPDGRTLYTFTKDTVGSGTSACYDQCAVNWPPLPVTAGAQPQGDYSILVRSDNSRQWAYKGQPLYYFVKDTQPGTKLGDGVNGVWKVARP
ncbi:ATP-binding protein [Paracidovorax wautersii]|uniref:Lipoprotein with Yx(FWY)xxD motif n=1 Tax=Paracidovorax wautersii TaxID=1177982 RepID=A0ABU1ICU1_9BURK|nr:ATP-binding protein [Paracidovorax wautersii]MDR6215043.1 putative lipoprotein with Yx(FWY)xxD motif [Paracidovorax wautersii]